MTVGHGQQQPQPFMMTPESLIQINQYLHNMTPAQQQAMLGKHGKKQM